MEIGAPPPSRWGRNDHMEVMDPGETERERIGEEIDIYSVENIAKLLSGFAEAKLIPEQLLLGACTFDVTEESEVKFGRRPTERLGFKLRKTKLSKQ